VEKKRKLLPNGFEINQKNVGETPVILRGCDAANEEVPPLCCYDPTRFFDDR
jgi:hypothetical protein